MDLRNIIVLLNLLFGAQGSSAQSPAPALRYQPEHYVCFRAARPLNIDGKIEEKDWAQVPWTADFTDIEGDKKPQPFYRTRAKILWDDTYLYIAAELEEGNLWATYDQHDAIIFHENNFEVFIDPDGDTHNYYELEINALGTVWDLLLLKPYRDGGPAINGWDISGLKKGVHLSGTLNDPSDTDEQWSIELAIPWNAIARQKPKEGDQWRVNFSRVEWRIENEGGAYRKSINPATGKPFPEFNWVWSPQGVVAMHQPETWGFVQFTETKAGEQKTEFQADPEEEIKWLLRQVYYAERKHMEQHGKYTPELSAMDQLPAIPLPWHLTIFADEHFFLARARSEKHSWYIREDGKVWRKKNL